MILRELSGRWGRSQRLAAVTVGLGLGLVVTGVPGGAIAQTSTPVAECNQLAEAVNQNQVIMAAFEAEIADFSQNAVQAETLGDIQAAAQQYVDAVDTVTRDLDGLIAGLDTLSLADDQLSSYRTQYVSVVGGFSAALDGVSKAMGDVAATPSEAELWDRLAVVQQETEEAVTQIEQLATEESQIIEGFNAYCGVTP